MKPLRDPTLPIREMAARFAGAAKGTACNQSSFKSDKGAFLYIGPGARGQGFKAMFKLDRSRAQADALARKEPERFEVGSTSWVTVRFSAERPLPKTIWEKWLKESHALSTAAPAAQDARKKAVKKVGSKKRPTAR